jgi:excisionase family DNA binding protein
MSVPDTTLQVLVGSIANQVAAQVKADIAAHMTQIVCRVQPALLSVKDAATYLGRSEQAVQHLIFQKDLPVVRAGRRVHIARADLDAWIEKNRY